MNEALSQRRYIFMARDNRPANIDARDLSGANQ